MSKKAISNIISFGIFALIGLLTTAVVFVISDSIKENSNESLIEEFSENIFLLIENKMISIEKLINASSGDSEIYIQIKEQIPGKIGDNTYTVHGENNTLIFKSQNFGYQAIKNLTWSYLNVQGLAFSGNKQIILEFNSSKSYDTVVLY